MPFSLILAIVFRSKSEQYEHKTNKIMNSNSQLKINQILTNNDQMLILCLSIFITTEQCSAHQNSNGQHTAVNIGPNQLWTFRTHRNNVATSEIYSSNYATLTDEIFWEFFLTYFLNVSLYQNELYGKMKCKLHFNAT